MSTSSLRRFTSWVSAPTILTVVLVVLFVLIVLTALFPTLMVVNSVKITKPEGAKEALALMKEWAVWMAGIQTATIAALGLMVKDRAELSRLGAWQKVLVVFVGVFNSLALFFSAWLLTSLSTLMLRVYETGRTQFDFYNWTLYAFMSDQQVWKGFTVAYFAFWNHTLWGAGILCFGALSVSLVLFRPSDQRAGLTESE